MDRTRFLIVTADDFGIGPSTSRGILGLASRARVTATVLLVNAPEAEGSVRAWRSAGEPVELGWHPCLTLDSPIAPVSEVQSLVDQQGCFLHVAPFLRRLALGAIASKDLIREFRAQYARFLELVGRPPRVVNAHHHLQIFAPVGDALLHVLGEAGCCPYIRRVREPWKTLLEVPGSRGKRACLTRLGAVAGCRLDGLGIPGNDWLAGLSDCSAVVDLDFFPRWLAAMPGRVVELVCHPGEYDANLEGRDGSARTGHLSRRVQELHLLGHDSFLEACTRAGFQCVTPAELIRLPRMGGRNAA
jgi:predicted glycoside hydrolase/deacetylase ChbG (UPF0249 family)